MEINYILIIVALVILLALFLKVFLAYWTIKNKLQKSTQTRYIYVEVPIEDLKVARNFGDYQKVFYEDDKISFKRNYGKIVLKINDNVK